MTPPAAAAAPAVRPRRPSAPRGPRRVSGPARPRSVPSPARTRTSAGQGGLLLGLISGLESLAQHRLLDRLIRGRTWIGIVAFALIGIVTLQLGLLKLNGGIGRALEHEALLQRENAALSIENSELAAGERVEARAAGLGMAFASSGALHFLATPSHNVVDKAAAALSSAARASATRAGETGAVAAAGESQESSQAGGEAASSGGEASSAQTSSESSGEAEAASSGSEESASSAESSSSSGESSGEATAPSGASASSGVSSEAEPSGGSSASPAGE